MGNPATLQPFKKGKDPRRNLKGKPKGTIGLKARLREALDDIQKGTGKNYAELFVEAMMKSGIKEDGQSRRLILQYLEGMPKETKDVNVTLPKPLLDLTKIEEDELLNNDGNQKDNEIKKEDKSSPGRDVSEQDNINTDLPDIASTK